MVHFLWLYPITIRACLLTIQLLLPFHVNCPRYQNLREADKKTESYIQTQKENKVRVHWHFAYLTLMFMLIINPGRSSLSSWREILEQFLISAISTDYMTLYLWRYNMYVFFQFVHICIHAILYVCIHIYVIMHYTTL